jgi:hypothetical protein
VLAYLLLRLPQVNRSKYAFGTKVAKVFHGTRHEGELLGYDAREDFYWILYSDDDFEDLDYTEMYQAVQEHGQEVKAMVWCSKSSSPAATVFRLIRKCVLALHMAGSSCPSRASSRQN